MFYMKANKHVNCKQHQKQITVQVCRLYNEAKQRKIKTWMELSWPDASEWLQPFGRPDYKHSNPVQEGKSSIQNMAWPDRASVNRVSIRPQTVRPCQANIREWHAGPWFTVAQTCGPNGGS